MVSVDLGYVQTSSDDFGSGLVYGAEAMEGTGKIGFGLAAQRFSNSTSQETSIESGGETTVFRSEEAFTDFYVTILATYSLRGTEDMPELLVGLGPQIHFVTATREIDREGFTQTAKDGRLGLGVFLRYQKRIRMFGKTALVLSAAYSWAQSVAPITDAYTPPTQSLTFGTITAGLAFPF